MKKLVQQEIENDLEVEYIYHTNRIEDSELTKWATERVLLEKAVDDRFKSKDIIAAQNHSRAIKFVSHTHHLGGPKYYSCVDMVNLLFSYMVL